MHFENNQKVNEDICDINKGNVLMNTNNDNPCLIKNMLNE